MQVTPITSEQAIAPIGPAPVQSTLPELTYSMPVRLFMKRIGPGMLLLNWLLSGAVAAGGVPKRDSSQTTDRAMRLLTANCLSCHNPEKHKGGLQLGTRADALKGGDDGPVLRPGHAEASLLFKALSAESDPHMPPKKQLSAKQIDLVRQWISHGANWDEAALAKAAGPREVMLRALPSSYQPVFALALSPDDHRLAIGRGNRILLVEASATNFLVAGQAEAHRDAVRSLAWSSDGQFLASGSFREIKLWRAATLEPLWSTSSNLLDRLTALRFTPDGKELIAADGATAQSGWVRILSVTEGIPLASWQAHSDTIFDLALSRDGKRLATASGDKLVKVWDLASRQELTRLEHAAAVYGASFNTDASELATVCADKQFKIWDAATRESIVNVTAKKRSFNALSWSGDGKTIAVVDEDGAIISLRDFKRHTGAQSSETASERQLGHGTEPLHAVAINGNGERLFAGGQDGIVYIVSGEGKLLAKLEPGLDSVSPVEARVNSEKGAARKLSPPSKQSAAKGAAQPPSFVRDVLPALAKAGCMSGSCHARAQGQNGFKLSVFSYDPKSDYAQIVKSGRGRRVFPAAPEESLLLLKPSASIEHGGGERFETGSETYNLLVDWIRGGMIYQHTNEPVLVSIRVEPHERTYRKKASQQLRVQAHYSDDSTREVTRLADYVANEKELARVNEHGEARIGSLSGECAIITRYMGFVDASLVTIPADHIFPEKLYAKLPVHNFIDELAYGRFRKLGFLPSDLCTDAEFLRRSSLDATGALPTPDEARAFLTDRNPEKRDQWIDHLLNHSAYADYWAGKWADLLRPNPDRVGVKSIFVLDEWLREEFRANTPYDQFVRQFILEEGNNHRDGPAVVYRDRREPPELTTLFSQVFLGARMECAKCHHHPNEKWSQNDFYQFAAFFGAMKQKGTGLSQPISGGAETFYFAPGGVVKHPVTEEVMRPRPPDGPLANVSTSTDPRRALADWLTDPKNPFFAKAAVNRVWASFFGRGFVQPVDDFRASNPGANEPLLAALAADFAQHDYDLKHLMRAILSSRLYQLSSTPNESNLADTRNFSRSYRRRLPAEVLLDAVTDITGLPEEFNGCPPGTRAVQTWSYKVKSQFLDAFGRPNPSTDCPCERDARASVVQSLHMMNSRSLQSKFSSPEGRLKKLADGKMTAEEIVAELYLSAFSRFPSAEELKTAAGAFVIPKATRQTATEDVLWALLNSAEFVLNH